MKTIKYFLFILLIVGFFIFFLIYNYSYVPFEPTGFDGDFTKLKIDEKAYERLEIVLDCYHVKFKKKQGVILVHRRLSREIDMLYNFTDKAIDEEWECPHGF